MVAPCGDETSWDLIFGVPYNLANEDKLLFGDLVPHRGNMAKMHVNWVVCNVLVNYLCNCYAKYSADVAVEKYF